MSCVGCVGESVSVSVCCVSSSPDVECDSQRRGAMCSAVCKVGVGVKMGNTLAKDITQMMPNVRLSRLSNKRRSHACTHLTSPENLVDYKNHLAFA